MHKIIMALGALVVLSGCGPLQNWILLVQFKNMQLNIARELVESN